MTGNSWTFFEYLFFGVVVFLVSAVDLVLEHWRITAFIVLVVGVLVLVRRATRMKLL
jgi:hypothetical protein